MLLLLTTSVFNFIAVRGELAHAQESVGQVAVEKRVFTKDMTIYVSDFDLDAADVKIDSGEWGVSYGLKLLKARESLKKEIRKRRRRSW